MRNLLKYLNKKRGPANMTTQQTQAKTCQRQRSGKIGEDLAANHLKLLGFQLITRNYRSKLGEIDLIAMRNEELHFCEVKRRGLGSLASALETISAQQQGKIYRTAQVYLQEHEGSWGADPPPCHFSVIAINETENGDSIEFFADAF